MSERIPISVGVADFRPNTPMLPLKRLYMPEAPLHSDVFNFAEESEMVTVFPARERNFTPTENYASALELSHHDPAALGFLLLTPTIPGKIAFTIARDLLPDDPASQAITGNKITRGLKKLEEKTAYIQYSERPNPKNKSKMSRHYSTTAIGEQMQAIVYHILKGLQEANESHGTNLALVRILGRASHQSKTDEDESASPIKRTPYIRAKIITAIASLEENQLLDTGSLARQLGIKRQTLQVNLSDLKKIGIAAQADSLRGTIYKVETKGFINLDRQRYKEVISDVLTLTHEYFTSLPSGSLVTATSLTDKLHPLHTERRKAQGKEPITRAEFIHNIYTLLPGLRRDAYFSSSDTFFRASLTPFGADVAIILTEAEEAFANPTKAGSMLSEFHQTSDSFLDNYTQELLKTHLEQDMDVQKREQRASRIIHILKSHGRLRTKEIATLAGIDPSWYLTHLKNAGVLVQEWEPSQGIEVRGVGSNYRLSQKALEILEQQPDISYARLQEEVQRSTEHNADQS